MDAPSHLRTALTLIVAVILVAVAAIWGWRAMTKPFPAVADVSVCEDVEVSAGDKIYPADVVLHVLNASSRSGLAERTVVEFTDEGFVEGGSGNAPSNTDVRHAQIWTEDPKNPAVRLVRSWLPKASVVKRKTDELGVVVVVGQDFGGAKGGKKSFVTKQDATICSPVDEPVDESDL